MYGVGGCVEGGPSVVGLGGDRISSEVDEDELSELSLKGNIISALTENGVGFFASVPQYATSNLLGFRHWITRYGLLYEGMNLSTIPGLREKLTSLTLSPTSYGITGCLASNLALSSSRKRTVFLRAVDSAVRALSKFVSSAVVNVGN